MAASRTFSFERQNSAPSLMQSFSRTGPPPAVVTLESVQTLTASRWLTKEELVQILCNWREIGFVLSTKASEKPPSGSFFVFDRAAVRNWRRDGYQWRGKSDRHEKLKIDGIDSIHCNYAHGAEDKSFQRRSYWLTDEFKGGPPEPRIVFVHYLMTDPARSRRKVAQPGDFGNLTALSPSTDLQRSPAGSLSKFGGSVGQPGAYPNAFPAPQTHPSYASAAGRANSRGMRASVTVGSVSSNDAPSTFLFSSPQQQQFPAPYSKGQPPVYSPNQYSVYSPQQQQYAGSRFSSGVNSIPAPLQRAPADRIVDTNRLSVNYIQGLGRRYSNSNGPSAPPIPSDLPYLESVNAPYPSMPNNASAAPGGWTIHPPPAAQMGEEVAQLPDNFVHHQRSNSLHSSLSVPKSEAGALPFSPGGVAGARRDSDVRVSPAVMLFSHARYSNTLRGSDTFGAQVALDKDFLLALLLKMEVLSERSRVPDANNPHTSSPSPHSMFSWTDITHCMLYGKGEDLLESLMLLHLQRLRQPSESAVSLLSSASGSSSSSDSSSAPPTTAVPSMISDWLRSRDELGREVLHYASAVGYIGLVTQFVQMGASVNAQDQQGRSPLHLAAMNGESAAVSALLSHGADERLFDNDGLTAPAAAEKAGHQQTVRLFLETREAEQPVPPEQLDALQSSSPQSSSMPSGNPNFLPRESSIASTGSDSEALTSPSRGGPDRTGSVSAKGMSMSGQRISTTGPRPSGGSMLHSPSNRDTHAGGDDLFIGRAFSQMTLKEMGISTAEIEKPGISDEVFAKGVKAIQRQFRFWLYRRHAAAKTLQAAARGMLVRRQVKRLRETAVKLQSTFRQRKARKDRSNPINQSMLSSGDSQRDSIASTDNRDSTANERGRGNNSNISNSGSPLAFRPVRPPAVPSISLSVSRAKAIEFEQAVPATPVEVAVPAARSPLALRGSPSSATIAREPAALSVSRSLSPSSANTAASSSAFSVKRQLVLPDPPTTAGMLSAPVSAETTPQSQMGSSISALGPSVTFDSLPDFPLPGSPRHFADSGQTLPFPGSHDNNQFLFSNQFGDHNVFTDPLPPLDMPLDTPTGSGFLSGTGSYSHTPTGPALTGSHPASMFSQHDQESVPMSLSYPESNNPQQNYFQ